MSKRALLAMATLITAVSLPLSVGAALPKVKGEVVMKVGNTVNLFDSGKPGVRNDICLGDVIKVYRVIGGGKNPKSIEVGQVKVTEFVGDHYAAATILSGDIKPGDIAKKNTTSCQLQKTS